MSAALIAALLFTGALMLTTAYFILGSIPLLVLKHDTPMDARFVRSFFNIYYQAALASASLAALAYLVAGHHTLAAGAAALAVLAYVLRKVLTTKMASLGERIAADQESAAIRGFRKTHATAIVINVVQLTVMVTSLISLSLQLKAS